MTVILYRRQRQIRDFIAQFIQGHGHSPTLVEIAKAIGVSSLATIHEHLQVLEKKGIISRFRGAVRGIELLDQRVGEVLSGIELPILGYIAAGAPLEPFTDPSAYLAVGPTLISGKKRSYVLQVKGESMIEDGILDGDYVVIEEQQTANNGDIVVALLDSGLATLKRYYRERDRIRLEPANATMAPIYAVNVKVQGRVVAVIRKYR